METILAITFFVLCCVDQQCLRSDLGLTQLCSCVRRSIKFFIKVDTELYRPTEVGIQYNNVAFRSDNYIVGDVTEVNLEEIAKHLVNKLDQFNERGSGWLLGYVSKCTVSTALYRPLSGSSFLPTPTIILNKKAVVNIENSDELCFIYNTIQYNIRLINQVVIPQLAIVK